MLNVPGEKSWNALIPSMHYAFVQLRIIEGILIRPNEANVVYLLRKPSIIVMVVEN